MKLHFDLSEAPSDFLKGFVAALEFSHEGSATVRVVKDSWVLFDAPNILEDNVTYTYKNGRIVFDSTGVEE